MNQITRFALLSCLLSGVFALSGEARAASMVVSPSLGSAATEISVEAEGVAGPVDYQLDFAGDPAVPVATLRSPGSGASAVRIDSPQWQSGHGCSVEQ